jgi:predicted GIY-YIG superfamily endonuclease
MEKRGYIYFMTNQNNNVLYTGVTNSLKRRIQEHYWEDLTGNIIIDPDIV